MLDVCNNLGEVEGISALVSNMDQSGKRQILERCGAESGDLILFAVGNNSSVNQTLDRLRMFFAHQLGLVDNVSFLLE